MATEKQIIANQQNAKHRDLEPNPADAVLGEMPFATDSRQKRSLISLKMLPITEPLREQ
jgi:hypothetical protein